VLAKLSFEYSLIGFTLEIEPHEMRGHKLISFNKRVSAKESVASIIFIKKIYI